MVMMVIDVDVNVWGNCVWIVETTDGQVNVVRFK